MLGFIKSSSFLKLAALSSAAIFVCYKWLTYRSPNATTLTATDNITTSAPSKPAENTSTISPALIAAAATVATTAVAIPFFYGKGDELLNKFTNNPVLIFTAAALSSITIVAAAANGFKLPRTRMAYFTPGSN